MAERIGPAFPDGVFAWLELTDDVERAWPWPYSNAQLQSVRDLLPKSSAHADWVLRKVVWIARLSLAARAARRDRPAKPDVRAELEQVRDLTDQLVRTLENLSSESHEWLESAPRAPTPAIPAPPVLKALGGLYELQQSFALRDLPAPSSERRGRPEGQHTRRLQNWFDFIWRQAHAGHPPRHGWPAFLEACLAPLELPHVGDRARRAQRRRP
jgi:hypothetical protein